VALPDTEEIMTQYRRVTDGRTDGQTYKHVALAKTRASIASRGKKRLKLGLRNFDRTDL